MKSYNTFSLYNLSKYRGEMYGVSMIWIVLHHAYLIGYEWSGASSVFAVGYLGVEVFLFLSGISLFFSFTADNSLLHFYIKRILRLLVPVFIILFPYYLWAFVQQGASPSQLFIKLFLNLTTLQFWIAGDSSTWFASMILVAYAIYPLLFRIVIRKNSTGYHILTAAFLCFVEMSICILIQKTMPALWGNIGIALIRFPVFTIGCFFGPHVYDRGKIPSIFVLLCFIFIGPSLAFIIMDTISKAFIIILRIFVGVAMSICLSFLFHLAASQKLTMINRFFKLLGSVTFEMYLVHIIAIILYKKSIFFVEGSLFRYLVLITLCLFVSFAYAFLDRQSIGFLKKKIFSI